MNAAEGKPWPAGGGQTGELLRNKAWDPTPLGPIDTWPRSLRTAIEIVLNSPVAIVMLWGPDGVMIYNDAYSIFAGGRHPRLFGSKVLEGWPEVADFNRRVMDVGLRGETLSFVDQPLVLSATGSQRRSGSTSTTAPCSMTTASRRACLPSWPRRRCACWPSGRRRTCWRAPNRAPPRCSNGSTRHRGSWRCCADRPISSRW
jgi:hypothetical protein